MAHLPLPCLSPLSSLQAYAPAKLPFGQPHPDSVVETASLAAVEPPDITYKLAVSCRAEQRQFLGSWLASGSLEELMCWLSMAMHTLPLLRASPEPARFAGALIFQHPPPRRHTTSCWAASARCSWRALSMPASGTSRCCQTAAAPASSSVRALRHGSSVL